jgi:hypothetical protein
MTTLEAGDPRVKRIKELYNQDENIRAFCDYLARRELNRHDWSIGSLEGPTRLGRGALIEVFRKFEKIDLGKFIVGRRGHPSRFDWEVTPLSVGKIAVGEASKLTLPTEDEMDSAEGDDPASSPPALIRHSFRLRPDFTWEFQLPMNLTPTEAARLADFIKTLPFTP